MLFCWFLEKSSEVCFQILVAKVLQMGATWGHFSRDVAANVETWKQWFRLHQLYFLEMWGAGLGRVGQLFSRSFLRWVWRGDFTFVWEIEGPTGSSKDVFWWAFQVQVLHRFLISPMENRIPSSSRGGGDFQVIWALISDYRSLKVDNIQQITDNKMKKQSAD